MRNRLSSVQQVAQWMKVMEQPVRDTPTFPPAAEGYLRLHLIQEETSELALALASQDMVAVLDALTDLQVVLDGTYVSLGLTEVKDAAFEEVMSSNYSKFDDQGRPVRNPTTGRIMKGPNFKEPDLISVLAFHPAKKVAAE